MKEFILILIVFFLLLSVQASAQHRKLPQRPQITDTKDPIPQRRIVVNHDEIEATVIESAYAVYDGFYRTDSATGKVSVEKLTDGSFMVYWPLQKKSEDECLVAFMRVPAVAKILNETVLEILHTGGTRYLPPKPLEETDGQPCV